MNKFPFADLGLELLPGLVRRRRVQLDHLVLHRLAVQALDRKIRVDREPSACPLCSLAPTKRLEALDNVVLKPHQRHEPLGVLLTHDELQCCHDLYVLCSGILSLGNRLLRNCVGR